MLKRWPHDMRTTAQGPRAYSFAVVNTGSSSRAVVRFTCVDCSHELELANNDPRRKHGAFFAQQARRRGWDTDGVAVQKVFCPDCRKTPASRSRKQIELDSVVLPALEPPIIEGTCELVTEPPPLPAAKWRREAGRRMDLAMSEGIAAWQPNQSLEEKLGEITVRAVEAMDSMPLLARGEKSMPRTREEQPMPRELTNEQRRQIRIMLDQYFDDKEGCYLPGENGEPMSDQAIGHAVGVPWGEVTKIRELSYGKIMVDPAVAALRTQMAELEKYKAEQLAELERRMAAMREALDGYGRKVAKAG